MILKTSTGILASYWHRAWARLGANDHGTTILRQNGRDAGSLRRIWPGHSRSEEEPQQPRRILAIEATFCGDIHGYSLT